MELGELITHLSYIAPENDAGFLMAVGERSLYCIRENGTPVFMHKLDSPPACIHPYGISTPDDGGSTCKSHANHMINWTDLLLFTVLT